MMEAMDMDLWDPKVTREVLVFLVILVYRVKKASRGAKDSKDREGTQDGMGSRVDQEIQVQVGIQDIQDTRVPKVPPETDLLNVA